MGNADRVLADKCLVLEHERLPGEDTAPSPGGKGLLRAGYGIQHLSLGTLRRAAKDLVRRWVVHLDELGAFRLCRREQRQVLVSVFGLQKA